MVTQLQRVALGKLGDDCGHREAFLQDLVHRNPQIIPMQDIEPAFMPMVSVCTELPMASGFLDNLWLTPEGGIILGECKRVRNTQARREVLVQALDYAQAMTKWTFDDLQEAVRKARRSPDLTLWSLVQAEADEAVREDGEAVFIDALQRRLRNGRFVVLVILDGVEEGLVSLTSYLQLHAGLHASIALVELSVWKGMGDDLLVIPRIPLRTVLVERGIVTISGTGQVSIEPPPSMISGKVSAAPKPYTLSEPEFYERLDSKVPGATARLKKFLASLDDIGITPEFRRSAILRWNPSPDVQASAGYIDDYGTGWLGDAFYSASKTGKPEAGKTYLERLARAVGGHVHWLPDNKVAPRVRGADGKMVRLADLLDHANEWKEAMAELTAALQKSEEIA